MPGWWVRTVAPAEAGFETFAEWRDGQRRVYDAVSDQTAALLGEPGWRLTDEEPMLVMWLRVVE